MRAEVETGDNLNLLVARRQTITATQRLTADLQHEHGRENYGGGYYGNA